MKEKYDKLKYIINKYYDCSLNKEQIVNEIISENIRNSHPSIFDRILLLTTTFTETIVGSDDFFQISKEEFKILGIKSITKFVASHFRKYKINKDNIMHEFMGLLDDYFNFKKEMNFDKYKKFIKDIR